MVPGMGVWPCGRVGVCLVVGWAMRSVQKTRVKLFRLSFSTGSASRNSQSQKVESKKPVFDCVSKPDLGFSRKRPFSTDKSDCIRNGLKCEFIIFPGIFFCMYKQLAIAPGSDNNHVSLRQSPRHFPEGNLVCVYKGSAPRAADAARYARARNTTQPNVKETGIKGA